MSSQVGAATRPLKVCLVGHAAAATLNFRGPLIKDLLGAGCHVVVLAPDWSPELKHRVESLGARAYAYPLLRTGLNPWHDVLSLVALVKRFRTEKPDVVLTYAAKTNVWGTLAAWLAKVPRRVAMVEGLGFALIEGSPGERSFKRRVAATALTLLYRWAFRMAHRVVILNPDDARDLQLCCGLPVHKTVLLGGIGVSLDEWPRCAAHVQPLTFTLVARLLRAKGVMEFLAAAREVKAKHPAVRFWLLGPLDDSPDGLGEADVRPWLQDGTVEWPGAVDVRPWLAQTSVFVLPSYREGVPRSTQEAMAMGRPVITTDVPGCRETVVDGVNGFLVPPRDTKALVMAMSRFIEQPELIERMGRESRRLAEERFDVRRANERLLRVLLQKG